MTKSEALASDFVDSLMRAGRPAFVCPGIDKGTGVL